jgi:hypothetical protein
LNAGCLHALGGDVGKRPGEAEGMDVAVVRADVDDAVHDRRRGVDVGDPQARRLHTLVAEGLQLLQNAGLVCMLDTPNSSSLYALTRSSEDVVARNAVPGSSRGRVLSVELESAPWEGRSWMSPMLNLWT